MGPSPSNMTGFLLADGAPRSALARDDLVKLWDPDPGDSLAPRMTVSILGAGAGGGSCSSAIYANGVLSLGLDTGQRDAFCAGTETVLGAPPSVYNDADCSF